MDLLILFFIVVFFIAFTNPPIGLLALPVVIAFSKPFPIEAVPIRVEDVLITALAFTWLIRLGGLRQGVLRTPLNAPMALYAIAGIACSLWGLIEGKLSTEQALFRNFKYIRLVV